MKNKRVYTESSHYCFRSVHAEKYYKFRSGQTLIVGIIFLAVVLILSSSLFSRVSSFVSFSSTSVVNEQATNLAEAGIEKALWQLNQTAGSYTGELNTALGTTGVFTVSIANKSSNIKTITSTGFVPNQTKPRSKRTLKVDAAIDNAQISFHYAVQVGTGGVIMNNNSVINGSLYSNKSGVSISGSNGSIITGDAYAAGSITTPNPTVLGTKHENETPAEMPEIDYQTWKDVATAGGTTTCTPTCNLATSNIGPGKYIGNLYITNGAIITLNGPVYVTGDVTVDNNGKVNLANSFGSNGTVFIADGTIAVSNNGGFNPNNSTPKGYILVVTTSTSASAITISNNGANAVFYALLGGATLSNNSQVTALVASSLTMGNNSTLNYDSGLASANFTSGPGASWLMKKGTYKFSQ